MKEIKVAKYSKQWCKTRMAILAIVSIVSFCVFCSDNANYGTFL